MRFEMRSFARYYYVFLFLFFPFLAISIGIGFVLHVPIGCLTLPLACIVYLLLCAGCAYIHKQPKKQLLFIPFAAVVTIGLSIVGSAAWSHTFDTSYDGQYYHEPAIVALSQGWDPLYRAEPRFSVPEPAIQALDAGSPKVMWSIEASIYSLTGSLNAATIVNPILCLIALCFVYDCLRTLGLTHRSALLLAILSTGTILMIDQIFSFREDALSYDMVLIGLASIGKLLRSNRHQATYLACLATSLLFLAGMKLSNLYIFLGLLVAAGFVIQRKKLYRLRRVQLTVAGLCVSGILLLWNPYVTNIAHFHAYDYPYNQPVFARSLRLTGVPANIRHDNRFELFYYGLFSASDLSDASTPSAYAHLKIPFSFDVADVSAEAQDDSKLVGGYGVLFSGIFLLCMVAIGYLALRKKTARDKRALGWVVVYTICALVACLLEPIPNYARYNGQLYILPIAILIAIMVLSHKSTFLKLMQWLIIDLVFDLFPAAINYGADFYTIDRQLSMLRASNTTYRVHAPAFYSDYHELQSFGVKIVVSPRPISCAQPIVLNGSAFTVLCATLHHAHQVPAITAPTSQTTSLRKN
jgi:hypothetical protein